jgi:hypothetical protein
MKVLSLTQPWAWLVVRPDVTDPAQRAALWAADLIKGVENRRWNTKFRGAFLIHAAKAMREADYDSAWSMAMDVGGMALAGAIPKPEQLERGGIVGATNLYTVIHPLRPIEMPQRLPWHMAEQYGFVIADTKPLPFLPCKGALGFWGNFEIRDGKAVRLDG